MRTAVLVLALASCTYSAPSTAVDAPVGDDDAPAPDADNPSLCTPSEVSCAGRVLRTCNASGDGFAAEVVCPLTCETDGCTQASNLEVALQTACTDAAPMFVATAASNNIAISGPNHTLACSDCGSIEPQRVELGDIDLLVYCVSRFELPEGKTLAIQAGLDAAVALFVAGDVVLDGTIDVRGTSDGNGTGSVTPPGGAGGFAGGTTASSTNGTGNPGSGACGGGGGASTAGALNVGGGGGGGGYTSLAASGGIGHQSDSTPASGGIAGALCTSGPAELEPLIGGSGGGGGGDGACNTTSCGRPGGGGGGAIQISATGTITINAAGRILATGGAGGFIANAGNARGGGGGGGAGGAILLEASTLSLAGTLDVRGGNGGASDNTAGGTGGTLTSAPGAGTDGGADLGGGGGGGAIGRIRLNAEAGAVCAPATATDPCTASTLKR